VDGRNETAQVKPICRLQSIGGFQSTMQLQKENCQAALVRMTTFHSDLILWPPSLGVIEPTRKIL